MGAILTALSNWLGGIFARLFSAIINHFLAVKALLGTLFLVIIPTILNNFVHKLLDTLFTTINQYLPETSPVGVSSVDFAGLAAYMLDKLGIFTAFTIILTAVAARWLISWIPFVGPK